MKKIKTLLTLCFAACLASSSSVCYAASEDNAHTIPRIDYTSPLKYELQPAGTIEDTDNSFYFGYNALLVQNGEDISILSSSAGTMASGIDNLDYLGGGLYRVRQPLEEDNVNKTGLYTSDGTTLIPMEAASIVRPNNREKDGSARFLCVIYTTEETDNEDECIIYFTDSMFSMSVGEDDVMYKGYAKIYDVEKQRFVPGIELNSVSRYGVHDLGESVAVEHGRTITMYDADGNILWETDGMLSDSSYDALVVSTGGKYYIVDASGKDTFNAENSISTVNEALNLFSVYDGEGDKPYHLIDMNGNRIIEDPQSAVYFANGKAFRTKDANDNYIVVSNDGTILAENVSSFNCPLGDYGIIRRDDSEAVTVVTPNGILSDLDAVSESNLIFSSGEDGVALNTGETFGSDVEASGVDPLLPGLASVYLTSSSGTKYAVYDFFTGEQILPPEYEDIRIAGDYLYANTSGSSSTDVWEVYKINVVPDAG